MKYKLTKRANPQNRAQEKWYAAPVYDGKINKTDLTKEIVGMSSLSRGDVSNVIENVIDVTPKYLLMGKIIKLGELGSFRLSFSSEGVENENEFTVAKISGVRVVFTPSPELRKMLSDIKFEKAT